VAVHRGHLQVGEALKKLARSGFDLRTVSVVGTDRHTEKNVYGYYSTGRRFEAWSSFGDFWDDVWAALTDEGVFFVPGIGPVLMAGPLVGWLVEALQNGVMVKRLSPVGAALVGKGVPPGSMLDYENAVRIDEYLLIASGPLSSLAKARPIIESTRARVTVHTL